jgi:heme-degrading monooxygenase HmoA
MPIMREWRAEIRRALKDEYVACVKATGIVGYLQTPGNLGAIVATCDIDTERTEIVTLSWWKDEDSIKAFAGSDISRALYYPEDDRFLLTRPQTVQHYDCSSSAGLFGRQEALSQLRPEKR